MKHLFPLWFLLLVVLGCAGTQQTSKQPQPTPSPTPITDFAELKVKTEKELIRDDDIPDIKALEQLIGWLEAIPKSSPSYKEAQGVLKRAKVKLELWKTEVDLLGPRPENSKFDGSVDVVDKYLKAVLNDYHNSEYVSWSPVAKVKEKGKPYWMVRLRLRAKNGFGALILRDTYYYIQQGQVVKTVGLN